MNLEKTKVGGITLPDIKAYYIGIVINTMWHLQKAILFHSDA